MKILDIPRSGSYQGVTSSRNRFGQYVRARATPVNPASTFQGVVRARMSINAAGWRTLTATQREGWISLGNSMTRTDSLGQSYNLTGFAAYCSVNNVRLADGLTVVAAAPALSTPVNIATLVITLTAAAFSLAYTVTPLAAATYLNVFVSPQRSQGRQFEGDFRLVATSAAAAASPFDIFTAYVARFGTPVVGNKVFLSIVTSTLGFESGPFLAAQVVA